MNGREWCPAHWLDEIVPQLCAAPTGFVKSVDGGFRLHARDNEEGDAYDGALEPGQIVGFCYTEERGSFEVEVYPGGSWAGPDDLPSGDGVLYWVDNDPDTIDDTPNGALCNCEPGWVELRAYFWSDEIPFRFDGERFVSCAGVA